MRKAWVGRESLAAFYALRLQGLQPDAFTYTAMLSECGKGLVAKVRLAAFDQVQQQGLKLN